MIVDLATTSWPEGAAEPDIVVVGAGAAGIAIAHELAGSRLRVLVLEAGGFQVVGFDDLDAAISGFGARTFVEGRGRGLGGTTALWAGQVLRLEPLDFSVRPWIPMSGWPIDLGLLEPFYRRAEVLLGLPAPPRQQDVWTKELGSLLAPDLVLRHSQFAPKPDMAALYAGDLARAANVIVLLNAPASRVLLNSDPSGLRSVQVTLPDRARRTIDAKAVVVSCGAVESARLLLASASLTAASRWPDAPLMGRCFQDHAHVVLELHARKSRVVAAALNSRMLGSRRVFPKLVATAQFQERHQVVSLGSDLGYIAAADSPVRGAAIVVRAARDTSVRREVPRALRSIATHPVPLVHALAGRLRHGYKLSEGDGRAHVGIQMETAPDERSRVLLRERDDTQWLPRAEIRWWVGELERRSARTFAAVLQKSFAVAGLGAIDAELPELEDDAGWIERVNTGHHHAGTLRMARDASRGVVDSNCEVHRIPRLFVAGGAVFPTSGFGNPTLTILALALRLADHLRATVAP